MVLFIRNLLWLSIVATAYAQSASTTTGSCDATSTSYYLQAKSTNTGLDGEYITITSNGYFVFSSTPSTTFNTDTARELLVDGGLFVTFPYTTGISSIRTATSTSDTKLTCSVDESSLALTCTNTDDLLFTSNGGYFALAKPLLFTYASYGLSKLTLQAVPYVPVCSSSSTTSSGTSSTTTESASTTTSESSSTLTTESVSTHTSESSSTLTTTSAYSSTTTTTVSSTSITLSSDPVTLSSTTSSLTGSSTSVSLISSLSPKSSVTTTSLPAGSTTLTVYATSVYTITACPPTITDCPLNSVITETIALYTTICPISNVAIATTSASAIASYKNSTVPSTLRSITPISSLTLAPSKTSSTVSTALYSVASISFSTLTSSVITNPASSKPVTSATSATTKPTTQTTQLVAPTIAVVATGDGNRIHTGMVWVPVAAAMAFML